MFMIVISTLLGAIIGSSVSYFVTRILSRAEIRKQKIILEVHEVKINERSKYLEKKCSELKSQLIKIENDCLIKNAELIENNIEISTLKQMLSNLSKLETKLQNKTSDINKISDHNIKLEKKVSEITTLLASERKYLSDRGNTFDALKNNIINEFKFMVENTFKKEGTKFTDYNKTQMDIIIQPLKNQLSEFRKKVEDVYDKESKDRYILLNEINKLKALNENISRDAINLTKALKGDIKIQGGWGELILEKVLETSGLQKGRSYDLQVQLNQPDGNKYRPDAIIHLPQGKDVIVDSKVSLKSYENYCSSETENERKLALKKHLMSLRLHIKTLASKSYEKLEGIKSLDFVLMFIPIEEAFIIATKEEPLIISEAFDSNIFIVCPSTLLITLRTINNIWQDTDQNQNAAIIAQCAGKMYDKFVAFLDSIDDIGKHLTKATDSYALAKKRLVSGKGNLIKRAENIKSLGLKTPKKLPKSFIN